MMIARSERNVRFEVLIRRRLFGGRQSRALGQLTPYRFRHQGLCKARHSSRFALHLETAKDPPYEAVVSVTETVGAEDGDDESLGHKKLLRKEVVEAGDVAEVGSQAGIVGYGLSETAWEPFSVDIEEGCYIF